MNLRSSILAFVAMPILVTQSLAAGPTLFQGHAFSGPPLSGGAEQPLVRVQTSDPRITALEEQVRQLNGRLEELNFLILQMQDEVRKMQEDNEFRLQQLEDRRTDAGTGTASRQRDVAGAQQDDAPPASGGAAPGEPPRTLGSITFDADGNPTGGAITSDGALPGVAGSGTAPKAGSNGSDDTVVAALPRTDSPDELYRNSYEFILSGDYGTAEAGFREHIERFPDDPKAADSHYWLGEALLGMERYRDAAEVFLAASQDYADSPKAPEMLLKLGISLAALNQRDVACATYSEIGKRYNTLSVALKDRIKQEQALAGC